MLSNCNWLFILGYIADFSVPDIYVSAVDTTMEAYVIED